MKLYSNFLKHRFILKEAQQAFPSKSSFDGRSGNKNRFMASMADPIFQSKSTQITNSFFLISVLQNSAISRSLRVGKMAHSCVLIAGFVSDLFINNNLLHMYWSCSSISDALKLFDEMPITDVVSWNTMVSGFVRSGSFEDGFCYFLRMKRVGMRPSQSSFASILVASIEMGSSENCRQIHCDSLKCGFSSDPHIGNTLLTAYARYGDVLDSRKMFDGMLNFDEISFEILLRCYIQHEKSSDALELFRYSSLVGVNFSCFALSGLISLCSSLGFINHAVQIHGYVVKAGFASDTSIVNSFITMYARSFLLEDAKFLFDQLKKRDIITWNSLIGGYAFNDHGDVGVGLVGRFLSTGMRMNESTFSNFLSSCASITVLENAKKVHVLILKLRESIDQGTENILLTMYCRCKSLSYASTVFNAMEERDVVSFNLLIGFVRDHSCFQESIELFYLAQLEGFKVDEITYSGVISSCTKLISLETGQQIHSCIIKTGFENIFPLANSLLGMYAQSGRFVEMEKIFSEIEKPDLFSWNMLIMGYAHHGLFNESIRLWRQMKEIGLEFNEFSYCAMIDACNCVETMVIGEQIQACIEKSGLVFDTALMNSLLTMYASYGRMDSALKVFEEIPLVDSVSWNAMISGYTQNELAEESIKFYLLMSHSGVNPNHMTFVSVSKSCAMLAELSLGSQFHAHVIKRSFESDIPVSNSYITMYGKCGSIHDSSKIFEDTIHRDVITWNSMIFACAYHGFGRKALEVFSKMRISGAKPNDVTFIGVLFACSHAGLVSEARDQFESMYRDHNMVPSEEHFACMVDLLCRAGRIVEAKNLIESMPFDPSSVIWKTLLMACRQNENVELGEVAAERIMQLEPQDSAAYVLLSNIYASVEKRENKAEMRRMMKDRGVKKVTGYSWIWS